MPDRVFAGCPTYDGRLEAATARALFGMASQCKDSRQVFSAAQCASLLSNNMNGLYCMALNARKTHNVNWFAMLHSDIEPPDWWVDIALDVAKAHDADLVTAIAPIKDHRGLTSTGIEHPDHTWTPFCRLTLSQVNHESFPDTFDLGTCVDALAKLPEGLAITAPRTRLLVNTGCMLLRLDKPWADKLLFSTRERIFNVEGKYINKVESEDWRFGNLVADFGGKVVATKALHITHHGVGSFESDLTWGDKQDEACIFERSRAPIYAQLP